MKKILAFALLYAICMAADAIEPYIELGLGQYLDIKYQEKITQEVQTIPGPFLRLKAGLKQDGLSLSWEHTSSVTSDRDKGLDFISVEYRWTP